MLNTWQANASWQVSGVPSWLVADPLAGMLASTVSEGAMTTLACSSVGMREQVEPYQAVLSVAPRVARGTFAQAELFKPPCAVAPLAALALREEARLSKGSVKSLTGAPQFASTASDPNP